MTALVWKLVSVNDMYVTCWCWWSLPCMLATWPFLHSLPPTYMLPPGRDLLSSALFFDELLTKMINKDN